MVRPNAAFFVLSWGAGSLLLHLSTALSTAGSTGVAAILALAVSRAATPRALNSAFTRTAAGIGSTETAPAPEDFPSPRARTSGPHAVSSAPPERRHRRASRDREGGNDSSSVPGETT
ncbi:MAG: hypothetical protein LC796_03850 [Acidobacteria bacterium]|nr:hypothetical protein [Acidobacteriota bacterium]MCA1611554.1 hypothetical protein [Acidobacteriota bacterium]